MMLEDLAGQPSRWPYRSNEKQTRWVPVVPATIRHGDRAIKTEGLVDSGADLTTMPIAWANELGVDLKRGTTKEIRMTLGAQPRKAYAPRETLIAEIAGRRVTLEPVFAGVDELTLGRADLFHAFRVTFDERARELVLDPYPPEG